MNIFLSAFAPENLVSRDGFGSPVPHQPAHLHTRANLVLTYGVPPEFRGVKPPYTIGSVTINPEEDMYSVLHIKLY